MVLASCGPNTQLVDLSQDARQKEVTLAQKFDAAGLVHMLALCENVQRAAKSSSVPRALFDALLVRLAMTDSAETVREVDRMITALEKKHGIPEGTVRITPSLETARGCWFAFDICSASPRVNAVSCGTAQDGDLQADLGYTWSPEGHEVLYVRSHVLLAAKAAGVKHVLDGTYAKIRDPEGLRTCCEAVRRLGYRGKSCIHPNQVALVNEVFTPTEKELDYYRRVIVAFDEAVARGSAATTIDGGTMIDYAMAETARRVLAWGDSAKRGGQDVG
jgi:citrate lyase subunit beta/citryl-CoA lyase